MRRNPWRLTSFAKHITRGKAAKGENMKQEKLTVRDLAQIAIVAAIYVALTITPPLNAISYGAYQFRISEMMNFMAFYNRKYIMGVTIGCMIANLYSFGIVMSLLAVGPPWSSCHWVSTFLVAIRINICLKA